MDGGNCLHCGKIVQVKFAKEKKKFCSPECRKAECVSPIKVKCGICNEMFWVVAQGRCIAKYCPVCTNAHKNIPPVKAIKKKSTVRLSTEEFVSTERLDISELRTRNAINMSVLNIISAVVRLNSPGSDLIYAIDNFSDDDWKLLDAVPINRVSTAIRAAVVRSVGSRGDA